MKDIPISARILEIKRKNRIRRWRLFIIFVILFFLFIGTLSYFSKHQKISISNIEIKGTHIVDSTKVEEEIYKNIKGRYWYLFSKANIFIYPRKKIYDSLMSNFPRIESLSIKRLNFSTLQIKIFERMGTSLYCGLEIPSQKKDIGENCYFVNNDGLIFDRAPYFSGNVYFKYYMKLKEDSQTILGMQMMDKDYFHKLVRFIDDIALLNFKPIYLIKDEYNIISLYLNHKEGDTTPKIIFRGEDDLAILLDDLALAIKKKEFIEEINTKYNKLLYIDLRFKNKILYKFE
jgi:hypothetical protein